MSARDFAHELGVDYVVEGSVRRSGDEVRVNVQLIDALSGYHVWADRYDGSLVNIEPIALPEIFDETIQSWDLAFKDTRASAYVAGQVWGRRAANKYLLDQARGKWDFVRTLQAIRDLTEKWPDAGAKLIEDKANGPAVMATLKNEISGLIPIEPQGSKESRAHAISPQAEAGNLILPHPVLYPWVNDFIEETVVFPNGLYADQVDSATQAIHRFQKRPPAALVLPGGGKRASVWKNA